MTTLPDRLRTEIEKFGSIQKFQEDVSEKLNRRKGSSYRYVFDYLKGRRAPGLEFLQSASEVLGVRMEWLRTGEGERTEHDGFIAAQNARTQHNRDLKTHWDAARSLDKWVGEALPGGAHNLSGYSIVAIQAFVEEVYRTLGPRAFGVKAIGGWRPEAGLSEGLSVGEPDVRAFVEERFGSLQALSPDAPLWERFAAVHSLLAHLYIREFGGGRT